MIDRADVKVMPPFVLLGFLGSQLLVAVLAPMRALPAPVGVFCSCFLRSGKSLARKRRSTSD